jgi:hypothetical protein
MPYRPGGVVGQGVGNIGKGIKSPLFSERLGASFADPNPNLRVERARTADVRRRGTLADQWLRSSLVYFDNDYKDPDRLPLRHVGDGIPNSSTSTVRPPRVSSSNFGSKAGGRVHGLGCLLARRHEVVTNLSTSRSFCQASRSCGDRSTPAHCARYVEDERRSMGMSASSDSATTNSFLSLRSVPIQQATWSSRTSRSIRDMPWLASAWT